MKKILLLLSIYCGISFMTKAQNYTKEIYASEAVTLNKSYLGSYSYDNNVLLIGKDDGSFPKKHRAYLKFIKPTLPDNAEITSIRLSFYVRSVNQDEYNHVTIFCKYSGNNTKISDAWDEMSSSTIYKTGGYLRSAYIIS